MIFVSRRAIRLAAAALVLISLAVTALAALATDLSAGASGAAACQYFYFAGQERICLTISTHYLAFRAEPPGDPDDLQRSFTSDPRLAQAVRSLTRLDPFDIMLVTLKPGLTESQILQLLQILRKHKAITMAMPVLEKDGGILIPTDEFNVKFKPGVSPDRVAALNAMHNVRAIRQASSVPGLYLMKADKSAGKDAIELANIYHRNSLVEWAAPNFISKAQFYGSGPGNEK